MDQCRSVEEVPTEIGSRLEFAREDTAGEIPGI